MFCLAGSCRTFHSLISPSDLYTSVILRNSKQAARFLKTLKKTSTNAQHVQQLSFTYPVGTTQDSVNLYIPYIGHDFGNSGTKPLYADIIVSIINLLPNLKYLVLEKVASTFCFSDSVLKSHANNMCPHSKRSLSVSMCSERGWKLCLKPDMILGLGTTIDRFELKNMMISSSTFIPSHQVDLVDQGHEFRLPAKTLVLSGCVIDCKPMHFSTLFANVTNLTLFNQHYMEYVPFIQGLENLTFLTLSALYPTPVPCILSDNRGIISRISRYDNSQDSSGTNRCFVSDFFDFLEAISTAKSLTMLTLYISSRLIPTTDNFNEYVFTNNLFKLLTEKFLYLDLVTLNFDANDIIPTVDLDRLAGTNIVIKCI